MNQAIKYIYQFDVASVLVSVAVLVSLIRSKTIKTRLVSSFKVLIYTIILSSLADVISIFMLRYPNISPQPLQWLVNIGYHCSFIAIPEIFFYCIYFSSEDNRIQDFWVRLLFNTPYLIEVFLLLTTPFSHMIFYFDETGYHRGHLFASTYACAAFYVLSTIYWSIKRRHQFSSEQFFIVYFFMTCVVSTIVVQFFFQNLMLMNFMLSISAVIIYLSLENPSDFMDSEMGVFNRSAFMEVMGQKTGSTKPLCIMGLQISDFKAMEEAIGRENRQKLLYHIGKSLMENCEKYNIFRISRSRIALIFEDSYKNTFTKINLIAESLLQPFKCGDVSLQITFKALYISFPDDANNVDDLLELLSHSFSKNISASDKSVPRVNREILLNRYREQKVLEHIKDAINHNSFEVFYQPIFDGKNKKITSAEALIRLRDKENNFISPDNFIPLTEKSGLILAIGKFVFKKVCQFLQDSKIHEKGVDHININLSVIQCMQEDLAAQLISIMDSFNLDHNLIHLEITENAAKNSKEILQTNMKKLSDQNVHFILDDYGNGYSNVSNLVAYPFESVKIDKTMLWAAMQDSNAYTVMEESIAMIKDMGLKVIAEGIESAEQSEVMKTMGCDYFQGFYYSVPLAPSAFIEKVKS